MDFDSIAAVYHRPLIQLVFDAATIHRQHHDPKKVQCATLLSAKTGGCPEDCAYCPQSSHYATGLDKQKMLKSDEIVEAAKKAKAEGADRFCVGTAWREVKDGAAFDEIVDAVSKTKALGLQTCVTLGMLNPSQAQRLRDAGLDYYNHNLDSSPEFYETIISTRSYQERLDTLDAVQNAGLKTCCGGIIGMGETDDDRIGLLTALAGLKEAPQSIPINALVRIEGTPLADRPPVQWHELVRMVAATRIIFPKSKVRLSAGRESFSDEAQAMAFLAGANSIFLGDVLLTAPNQDTHRDQRLLNIMGLEPEANNRERHFSPALV